MTKSGANATLPTRANGQQILDHQTAGLSQQQMSNRSSDEASRRWPRKVISLHLACLLAYGNTGAAAAGSVQQVRIQPMALKAHMEFLADDLLEGRESGTRGYDIAARYVASQFREIGLEPAGTEGFFQPVPLRWSQLVPNSVSLALGQGNTRILFTDQDHIVAFASDTKADQRISAELVFAGAGVVAPKYHRDDYAGLDVAGKVVVVLGGPSGGLPPEPAAHLASPAEQAARAGERGALGIIIVYTPALERRFPFQELANVARLPRLSWSDPKIPAKAGAVLAFVDEVGASELFAGSAKTYAEVRDAQEPRGFPLRYRVEFTRRSKHSNVSSSNVAAILPGSDRSLRQEVILVTSHLDHVGIGPAIDGDTIYNGALDNASGIAATLEIARAMRRSPPRRSVMFLAVTAEEKGLIGSDYFAQVPTVERDRIAGVINIDGVMALYDFQSIVGYGAESSTLGQALRKATKSMGVSLMPDPDPSLSIFTRSDHYSFVKRGIPAVFLQLGDGIAPDGETGLEVNRQWDEAHLHKPSDDLRHPIDYAVFARFSEMLRRFIRKAANGERPRWYRGDFFGESFAPTAHKAPPPAHTGKND